MGAGTVHTPEPGRLMTVRPFVAERPREYAPTPRRSTVVTRRPAPPGPRARVPGELLVRFQRDTPSFLLDMRNRYGPASSFFLGGELFLGMFSPAMSTRSPSRSRAPSSRAWASNACEGSRRRALDQRRADPSSPPAHDAAALPQGLTRRLRRGDVCALARHRRLMAGRLHH